jgi:hypothetical protein
MSEDLVVTKQQFIEAMKKWENENYLRISNLDFTFEDITDAGFVLLNKKALEGRLTSGNAKAEIANKLIKEILGDKPE